MNIRPDPHDFLLYRDGFSLSTLYRKTQDLDCPVLLTIQVCVCVCVCVEKEKKSSYLSKQESIAVEIIKREPPCM